MEQTAVARKKSKRGKSVRRSIAVTIKGDEKWKAWLEEAAVHCRLSVSALVDIAVTHYAKAEGFEKKPPER
jgi:predicted NBD/HSP70 family sugar kinase